MPTPGSAQHSVLIDYMTGVSTPLVSYTSRLPLGGVTFSRCSFPPNPGITLGSTQSIVAVHADPSFEIEWRDPDRDQLRQSRVCSGDMNVNCADLPVFHRWAVTARALVIAVENRFLTRTFTEAFGRDAEQLPVLVGVTDPVVQRIASLCDQEIEERGAEGRIYAEGLATALVVHLFRRYGFRQYRLPTIMGGLPAAQLRRVTDYIEANLETDVGLAELAGLVGLSPHHFGQAFKASIGMPPYRYVIQRRVVRARELLLSSRQPAAEIAAQVGFSSQSHMIFQFRKLTGMTPSRYRRERGVSGR